MPFQKGQSGNPDGRPKGSINRNTMLRKIIEPHKEELLNKAIALALDGNEQMLRLLLERMLPPKPKDEPVAGIDISGIDPRHDGVEIVQQVALGGLSPEEGNTLLMLVANNTKLMERTELLERLEALEAVCEKNDSVTG